jgi:diguanylate cyclase (GGDEF)-like protein
MLVTPMSAIIGMTSLIMAGQATWGNFQLSWTSWWLGEATSDLILTPVIVLWALAPPSKWKPMRFLEGALLIVSLSAVGLVAFGRLLPFAAQHEPLEFLCMPFLVWIAFRFQQRIVASAMVALATIVVGGTLLGYGPFAGDPRDNSLLMLQTFLATLAIVSLVVAAVMTDRRVVERQMLDLAVRDPLTGLANYRKLFEVLGAEISRSRRTGQQFTVLFVDVDGLKQINNRHGHLVGSEVLCKVGEALRSSCRSVDTPARFGGDEFAVILPATGPDGARVVAARVSDWLAEFANTPPVTVSVGAAVFPDDGATPDTLLSVADRLQYQMKSDGYSRLQ